MKASTKYIFSALVVCFMSSAASAATLVCSSSGQAYLITESGGSTSVAFAGGCAGGPWAIDAILVPAGDVGTPETNWRDNRVLSQAYSTLSRLPNRDLIWARAPAPLRAVFENLRIGDRLVIRAERVRPRVARSLLPRRR